MKTTIYFWDTFSKMVSHFSQKFSDNMTNNEYAILASAAVDRMMYRNSHLSENLKPAVVIKVTNECGVIVANGIYGNEGNKCFTYICPNDSKKASKLAREQCKLFENSKG